MSLFVGNLPFQLTDDEFQAAFTQFGAIAGSKIATETRYGRSRSRGYGFIDFADPSGLANCLESGVEVVLKDRLLAYREARPTPEIKDTAFVSGLPAGATDEDLASHFASYSPIEAKVVHPGSAGRPGFGFAKFETEAARDEAIAGLNGSTLLDAELVVRPASRPFRTEEEQRKRPR
jgi:RNA recognition motif-containing protein